MFGRQREGSVVCRSCGSLVGVRDERCYSCGARNPALWGYAPLVRRLGGEDLGFTKIVLGGCIALFVVSLLFDPGAVREGGGLFGFLSPSGEGLFLLGASGVAPVIQYGRWWTVLSAGWLHGGILHIFFNLYWARMLIPLGARLYGPGRLVILYIVSSVGGFLLSTFASYGLLLMMNAGTPGAGLLARVLGLAGVTVGASAALMGMFGALVHYGKRGGSADLSRWAWGYVIAILVIGVVFPFVDNWAHIGGFLTGWLGAKILDPMKPERLDHLVVALVLLVLTVASIALSVATGLELPRG